MRRLPTLSAREVTKRLKKVGFVFDRYAKGSHEIWYNPVTKRRTTVPNHPGRDIPRGTLRAIIEQTGRTIDEFLQ